MFFLPLKLQGCKNEILNYDSCTKPKLIIGPRRFLFLKHWMRNERHQTLQHGSLREVSRVPSFLGKSLSEEELLKAYLSLPYLLLLPDPSDVTITAQENL